MLRTVSHTLLILSSLKQQMLSVGIIMAQPRWHSRYTKLKRMVRPSVVHPTSVSVFGRPVFYFCFLFVPWTKSFMDEFVCDARGVCHWNARTRNSPTLRVLSLLSRRRHAKLCPLGHIVKVFWACRSRAGYDALPRWGESFSIIENA